MARIYAPEARKGKEITLSKDQVRHLKVLRLKEGEKFRVFDGQGHEYEAVYSQKVREGKVLLEKEVKAREEPKVKITLAVAVPKGNRMDFLVEKVSELGVLNIVPIICSRSVVKPKETKVERLRRIVIEAACQSERCIVPTISEPLPFGELLSTIKDYNQALICHKTGHPLAEEYSDPATVLVIIGPEGDFTQAELDAAKEAGCTFVSLSPTILRVETAAVAAVSQLIALSERKR